MDKLKETTQLLYALLEAYFIAQKIGHPKVNKRFRFSKLSNKHIYALLYAIREYTNEFSILLPTLDNVKKNTLFYTLVNVFEELLKLHRFLTPEKDLFILQNKEDIYGGPETDIGELESQISSELATFEPEEDNEMEKE